MAKQYGLIKPDKGKVIIRPSIFNSDSDSNDEPEKPTGISKLKKKERIAQQKAVLEDPTIYQYDELYDDMQSKKKESKLARKDLEKKPKYINKLLESAERRKRENERRIERQVQKEREEEGDMFKDKESFVTSAYKKKLEELKELEEREKREEYLETIGDVKKQSDLSGFYRHLYSQQVNFDENVNSDTETKDKSPNKPETKDKSPNKPETDEATPETSDKPAKTQIRKRKYRKREHSNSENSDTENIKLEHLPSNIDADSDFSIDSDSENSDADIEAKKAKPENENQEKTKTEENKTELEQKTDEKQVEESKETIEIKVEEVKKEVIKKPKKDIWKKRTVGEVFDEALKRYYERKSARLQVVS